MKKLLCSIAAFIFLAQLCQAGAALCESGATTEINASDSNEQRKDKEFVMKAAAGSRLEVTLGQLAAGNGSTQTVRDFGQQMVTDHSKANAELEALAQSKNIMLPGSTEKEHQKEVDRLSKLKGADFDKAYMKLMVEDHHKDIDLFEREADKGSDAELKSWAAAQLPVLRHHLHMAEDAERSPGQ